MKKKLGFYDDYKYQILIVKITATNLGKCPPPLQGNYLLIERHMLQNQGILLQYLKFN